MLDLRNPRRADFRARSTAGRVHRSRVELLSLEHWLGRDDPGGKKRGGIQQRGMGDFVLCAACNNLTGRRYVPKLEHWCRAGEWLLGELPSGEAEDQDPEEKVVSFGVKGCRPVLLCKQIAAIMLATNGDRFRQNNAALAEFVLDPAQVGFPAGYDIYLVLYRGPNSRHSGVAGRLDVGTGNTTVICEIAHPPFAYLMSFDEPQPALPVGRITDLAQHGLDEAVDVG